MSGRGRGRPITNNFDLNSPLRRPSPSTIEAFTYVPSNSDNVKSNDHNGHENTQNDSVSYAMSQIGISGVRNATIDPQENAEQITQTLKDATSSSNTLATSASGLFKYGLLGKPEATTSALVVKNLEKFTIDEVNFRVVFLDEMGATFEKIDSIRKNDPRKFQNFVVLLCEVSYQFPKIIVVRNAMLEGLGMLLDEGTNEDIYIFMEEMKKIGPRLISEEPESLSNIMIKVRKVILLSQTSNRSRCLLMECLELYLNNWKILPMSVKKFYDSYF